MRPRRLNNNDQATYLQGSVEEMEFSWTWGTSGKDANKSGGGFVKDTKLSIRGATFRVVLGEQQETLEEQEMNTPASSTPSQSSETEDATNNGDSIRSTGSTNSTRSTASTAMKEGYIQRQMQQIVDHLTLDISDLMLMVETAESQDVCSGLSFAAKAFQLVSLGRQASAMFDEDVSESAETNSQQSPPLSQRMSLESISARVLLSREEELETNSLPLLDPIGHAASVTRVAGRRFRDGWSNGLEIVGDILLVPQECCSSGLVLHAGTVQTESICRLMDLCGSAGLPKDEENAEDFLDLEHAAAGATAGPTTEMCLPLPSASVILPEQTAIRLPGCSFRYNADGGMPRLKGNQGVWVADQHFLCIGGAMSDKDPPTAEWAIDFVGNNVSLNLNANHAVASSVASVEWNDTIMKQTFKELELIMSSIPDKVIEQAKTALEGTQKTLKANTFQWLLESDGAIGFSMSCGDDWVHAKLQSLCLGVSNNGETGSIQIDCLDVGGIDIGPMSFGKLQSTNLQVPAMSLEDATEEPSTIKRLALHGCINGVLESTSVATNLQEMFSTLVTYETSTNKGVPFAEHNSTDKAGATPSATWKGIPTLIPSCRMTVKDPRLLEFNAQDTAIRVDEAQAATATCSMDHTFETLGDVLVSVVDLKARLKHSTQQIDFLVAEMTAQGDSGFDASWSNLHAEWTPSHATVAVRQVGTCSVPNLFELLDPIHNISIRCTEGVFDMGEMAVRGVCPLMISSPRHIDVDTQAKENEMQPKAFPLSIHLKLSCLQLLPTVASSTSLNIASASLSLSQVGDHFSVKNSSGFKARIVDSVTHHWMQSAIGPASGFFDLASSSLPSKASCESIGAGPSSQGEMNVTIPSVEMGEDQVVSCGDVSGVVRSPGLIQSVIHLWKACFPSKNTDPSNLSFAIPKATMKVSSMNATAVGENTSSASPFHRVSCRCFGVQDANGCSAAFSDIMARMEASSFFLEVSGIDAFHMPGVCGMQKPVWGIARLQFQDDEAHIEVPRVEIIMFSGENEEKTSQAATTDKENQFQLPHPIRCIFHEAILTHASLGRDPTKFSRLTCRLEPNNLGESPSQSTTFRINLQRLENKLVRLAGTAASGIASFDGVATVRQLHFATEPAEVSAGFSAVDWSVVFGQNQRKKSDPIKLPFAVLRNAEVRVTCDGAAVGVEKTAVTIPAHKGGPKKNLKVHFAFQ